MFELEETGELGGAKIKVIGIGGGGCNAINTMISSQMEGVEFIAANTDLQALKLSKAPTKLQFGTKLTKGLGTGGNPEVGKNAALEDKEALRDVLKDSDMVFITAGLGGGTGTGGAPVIADIAKEIEALTVAVVTKPFLFEGSRRQKAAEKGMAELKESVDTLITIPNQKLLSVVEKSTTLIDSFKKADEVLLHAVKGISNLITIPGLINLDFADVKTIMSEMGMAFMGIGHAQGENRAAEAAQRAISSPLLEDVSIEGARGILINVTGGSKLSLYEVHEASTLIMEEAHKDANIIFGAVINDQMENDILITVIATGFGKEEARAETKSFAAVSKYIKEENYDIPPFMRKDAMPESPIEIGKDDFMFNKPLNGEDDYDSPTFMRKQVSRLIKFTNS